MMNLSYNDIQVIGMLVPLFSFIGTILVAFKRKLGWVLRLVGSIIGLIISCLQCNYWTLVLFIGFTFLDLAGIIIWYRRKS